MVCEWIPAVPKQLTPREWHRYKVARLVVAKRFATITQKAIMCADIEPGGQVGAHVTLVFPDGHVEIVPLEKAD